ncbi:exported hypothetical protein [Paraburkholderia piptadeniae]|uniref:Uncharacterized protein n=1 Tax=Paraburkholderia piptadeniae TaxID=1701573 RepID=A0A1N7S9N5_9BURK|nr:exported hypothetical protein [Paraburkholderia piptadeniae]
MYQATWLPSDLTAGLVLTTMLAPVGIAYAEASGVPAEVHCPECGGSAHFRG